MINREINTAPEVTQGERVGYVEGMEYGSSLIIVFPFVSTGVCRREGGYTWKRMDLCRDRQKDERKALLCFICSFLYR